MTPHAATVETLSLHALGGIVETLTLHERGGIVETLGAYEGICLCGHETVPATNPDAMHERHATHQADILAAAGVLPTWQEWGVSVRAGGIEPADSARTAHQIAEVFGSEVFTRYVTEWVGSGG